MDAASVILIPERARKLRDLVWIISSLNDNSDEDLIHDQLMDEDQFGV